MSTLYRKYRPQTWRDVAGQEHVKSTLAQEVKSGRTAHAYLFSGPRGVGKTTIARILARALNCEGASSHPDLGGSPCGGCVSCQRVLQGQTMDIIEMDAASNRGIDAVRDNVIENSRFAPSALAKKVFIIDEVHMLTTEAFNALLKTLEEPPSHAVFILATTELHKVPATVISRCQRFDFRKIPFSESVQRLAKVAESEGVKLDQETLEEIARTSEGCLRDAESLLGKVVTLGDGQRVSHEEASVVLPRSDWRLLGEYVEALIDRDAPRAIAAVHEALAAGTHATEMADGLVSLLRSIMLTKLSGDAAFAGSDLDETRRRQLADWAGKSDLARLVRLTELMMDKRRETKTSHPPQLPLEIAAVRMSDDAVTSEAVQENHSVKKVKPAKAVSKKTAARPVEAQEAEQEKPAVAVAEKAEVAEAVREPVAAPVAAEAPQADEETVETSVDETAQTEESDPLCSLDKLKECWPQFVKKASEVNFSLPYLLGIGRPIEVRGDVAVIGFGFAFHCEKFNDVKIRQQMEQAFSEVLGAPVKLEAKLVQEKPEEAGGAAHAVEGVGSTVHDDLASAFEGEVIG